MRKPPRRARALVATLAAALLVTLVAAAPPGSAHRAEPPPATGTPTTGTTSVPAEGAGPGRSSAPTWLPLRRNADGAEIKVGCTYDSHGPQFGYECAGHHDRWAIDFIADAGTPVYAAGRGFATDESGRGGSSGYGNVVMIDHSYGIRSLYAHLSEVDIPAEGMWVDEHTVIGKVGSTGSSSANHLHYEQRIDGVAGPVDPGPLKACALGAQVAYPAIRGHDSWYGLPWGAMTVYSDGVDCPTVAEAERRLVAESATAARIRDGLPSAFLLYLLARLGEDAAA